MVHRSTLSTSLLAVAGLLAAACGGGSNVSNASPRISEVPQQLTTGDSAFSLDLGDYVTDREAAPLTYAVTTGGGAFAGSTYSNTFDTMGEHTVGFTVSDGSKTTTGSFRVRVTEADLVVVCEDASGLLLLDSRSNEFVRVAASTTTPSFAAGLADGRLVYQRAVPSGQQLWVFDPMTRTSTQIGVGETGSVVYRAKTSDGRIVFTAGTSVESTLFIHNPVTGVTREIAQGALGTLTVLVNDDDLVFYEVGSGGQADVYYYDPSEDDSFAVGTAATNEQLQAVLPNGGVVFTRVGAGGEDDLFYYERGTGLVEIGADVSAVATWDKTYNDRGSGSQVVFTAQSGVVSELYTWNPTSGQTTAVSGVFGAGNYDLFAALGAGNEMVFYRVVSGTEADAFFYDLDSGTSGTVRNGADISAVLRVTSDGTTAWAIVQPSGTPSNVLAVSLVATPATQTYAAGGTASATVGVLANGDIVAQRADGTALNVFDASAGTWGTPITGTGLAFAGAGLSPEDFVYTLTVSGQTDLSMWDASATASVVVSDAAGNDTFAEATANGTILFTRVVTGNTNTDLFVWDGSAATQLTDEDSAGLLHDHSVLGKYSGTR